MSVSLHQLNQIDVVKRLHHLLLIQYILGKNETTKDLKIIMQLNNNYDFVMSFEI